MPFFWIVVIIIVVWYLASRSKKPVVVASAVEPENEESEAVITEEAVFKAEAYFDRKIREEIDFPDAIYGYPIFVYKNLMRQWYKELSGQNRYNDEMTQRLRSDWTDYMWSIERRATWWYLYSETPEEEIESDKAKSYIERAGIASEKIIAIEDGFAALVGKDALKELKRIRQIKEENRFKFDRFGNLAPEGFEYDFRGELREEKKDSTLKEV